MMMLVDMGGLMALERRVELLGLGLERALLGLIVAALHLQICTSPTARMEEMS